MRLSKPRVYTWVIGVILLVLAVLGHEGILDSLRQASFWMAGGGLALMLVAALVRGL